MKVTASALLAIASIIPLAARAVGPAASCESLASMTLAHTQITRAQSVPAGQFAGTPSGLLAPGAPAFKPYSTLPAFCRVAATLRPSSDSDITMELWLPAADWNGRFEALGNGGWGGAISVQGLAGGIARGLAIAATDTGHATAGGSFAADHPERVVDFAYRAVHEMTVAARRVIEAFYGRAPAHAYWNGCSTGGRQGLMEAQRFPADYDGIVAGAPANYMTHMLAQEISIAQATLTDPASFIPKEKYSVIHHAVIAACDAIDGVRDGVLEDPRQCRFDPKTIQCPAGEDTLSCLTPAQVDAARKIYAPVKNPRTGIDIFPGLEPGSELGWAGLAGGPAPMSIPDDYFKHVVFKNPAWDFRTLDLDKDVARADALDRDHDHMNAIDPKLQPFVQRGGKLLLYHGWSDPLIAPENTARYYESVVNALGGASRTQESIRLFMEPGVGHCVGGEGPSNFDSFAIIRDWVEVGKAPDRIVATHLTNGAADRTRPLCPFPQVSVYRGSGTTDEAANFVCKAR